MSRMRLATLAIALLGAMTLMTSGILAQDDPLKGTTVVGLGAIVPSRLSDNTLSLVQLTMEPGASIAMHHHPGPVIIAVQSGEFTTSFDSGTVTLTRAAKDGQDATTETLDPGEKYVLEPGDSIAYDDDAMGHYMANEGTEPLVLEAATLWTTGEPGFIFEDMGDMGTATPTS